MGRSSKATYAKLYEIASAQEGFFTTRQALSVGYTDNVHPYHVQNGDWQRVHRGIYRLSLFPESPAPMLMIVSLWSQNRDGKTLGVFSHQTADAILNGELEGISKIHLTVPPDFRRKTGSLPIVLHYDELSSEDCTTRGRFTLTNKERTRLDLGHTPSAPKKTDTANRQPSSPPEEPAPENPADWAAWA